MGSSGKLVDMSFRQMFARVPPRSPLPSARRVPPRPPLPPRYRVPPRAPLPPGRRYGYRARPRYGLRGAEETLGAVGAPDVLYGMIPMSIAVAAGFWMALRG